MATKPTLEESHMKLHALLAALSAGIFTAGASAQITGTVLLDGKAPEPQEISMAADAKCAAAHADPVYDESIVAGEKGELANVVVSEIGRASWRERASSSEGGVWTL